ncbi:hypothetical protein Back11_58000 [Paenibacillus baekrokdamisoli]|uniref:YfjL-like N-terminal domain-containing protein n=1 Tax=Paenibacillus baekrokdamisoli TaxID=1712516 RepID=A0A3G9J7W5_9BACL|nr:hypothetical protein [Paenibacillus baekrokdamisoli]MBB3072897.1 hypothetical protein [Paenibacillus baekrokdamisoli]BBH24455.1 hypothetical protein Back11_58000 [Paenibacillus baekrokdamisoli]
MRIIKRLLTLAIVLLPLIFGSYIYSIFYGNPIDKYLIKKEVKSYLQDRYQDQSAISEVYYSFKLSTFGDMDYTTYAYFMTYAVHSNRWKTINSHRNVN